MGAVKSLCSKVLWLEKGKIKKIGDTVQLIDQYLARNLKESKTSVKTGNNKRNGNLGTRARIQSVSLNNENSVKAGEPLKIEFEIEVFSEIEKGAIGLGFSMFDGTRLLTIDSDLNGPKINFKKGKKYLLKAEITSLPLQPATYLIDLGIRSGDTTLVDYLSNTFAVEVQAGKQTPAFLMQNHTQGVRIPATWSSQNA